MFGKTGKAQIKYLKYESKKRCSEYFTEVDPVTNLPQGRLMCVKQGKKRDRVEFYRTNNDNIKEVGRYVEISGPLEASNERLYIELGEVY